MMVRLTSWRICEIEDGFFMLYGTVSGHVKLSDGMYIHTSIIRSISTKDDEFIVNTHNTEYHLKFRDINLKIKWRLTKKRKREFEETSTTYIANIYDGLGLLSRALLSERAIERYIAKFSGISVEIRGLIENIWKAYKEKEDQESEKRERIIEKLNNGEIYLAIGSNGSYYFRFACIKDYKGNIITKENAHVHVSRHQDSVLVSEFVDNNSEYYDLAYFPYKDNKIEFYGTHIAHPGIKEGEEVFYLYNDGATDIIYRLWGKTYKLLSGEEHRITKDMERPSIEDDTEDIDLNNIMPLD